MTIQPVTSHVAVCCDPPIDRMLMLAVEQLAGETGLRVARLGDQRYDLMLTLTHDRVELRWQGVDDEGRTDTLKPTFVNLTVIDGLSPRGRSLRQPVARAVGLAKGDPYRPVVLDATAGYGEDAWLLASLGCRVIAAERSPVMAALLADGLRRAAQLQPDIAARITLHHGDSVELMRQFAARVQSRDELPGVVYVDPMFPPRGKSARQRKPMWLLRKLVGDDEGDSVALFEEALRIAQRRVVVKRPLHAPPIADRPPAALHKGRAFRYDVYPAG